MTVLALSPRTRKRLINRGLDALTWLVLAVMLAPVFWLVASALQNDGQLARGSYDLLHPTFQAFRDMWKTIDFERYLINSAIICTAAALLATAFASTAGYALARFRFHGARPFGLAVIGTLWLKRHAGIQLFDTRVGMILVYTAFFTPVSIYFMRSFFQAIPRDLEEAAQVDGCSQFSAFVRIILPSAAPGLVATFVYAFLFAWDELLFVASLTEHNAETLPLGIRLFIGNYSQYYGQLMAAGVISTIPVVVAFFAAQRWLVRGITAGAVKG